MLSVGKTPGEKPVRPLSKNTINYKASVRDHFHQQEFNFPLSPPLALQRNVSDQSALVDFMTQAVKIHHHTLVQAYPWRCVECGLPATSLIHQPHSWIHHEEDPFIYDQVTPICVDMSPCAKKVHKEEHQRSQDVYDTIDKYLPNYKVNTCRHCEKVDKELKRCGKCKMAKYCSNECQLADWPTHKLVCKKIAKF